MNNVYSMSASFEAKKNSQAIMITIGFAGLLLLIMFLWSWTIPAIVPMPPDQGIMVELNIPEEEIPPAKQLGGGGGGGNPVEASGPAGTAPQTPPQPGTREDAKDIEEDPTEKVAPAILKPDNPKPKATKINENKSPVKAEPKPDPPPPQPKPKAVLGKTTTGSGSGGGVATTYDRAGGSGTGSGVGNGSGSGGGSGTGSGGGNGSGSGRGNGPLRISGSRVVINPKSMDAGENLKGKVLAQIRVSPDGVGTYLNWVQGSTITNGEAISIIKEWLRRNRFNKAAEESIVVYQFNFLLGG
ncbi:MAG: hypothetical protein ACTHMV_19890 [Chitinophagaceae bacterium]